MRGDCARKHGDGNRQNTADEYDIWRAMKARCYYQKHIGFRYYGGRGITVCDRWRESYETFLSDMGRRPTTAHSIDRIDPNGNYEPGNCRWATHSEQRRNKRPTHARLPLSAA